MITLKPLQAITNAPPEYDYGWMHTVVFHIAEDKKGQPCRLVENDDDYHFRSQLQRYGSGLYWALETDAQVNDFINFDDLRWTPEKAVRYHRIKVDMRQTLDWTREDKLGFVTDFLHSLSVNSPTTYTQGHDMIYFFTARGEEAFEALKLKFKELGLTWDFWGPSKDSD